MAEFEYHPEVDYKAIDEKDDQTVIQLLDPFNKGLLRPFESHILNADGLRKYLAGPTVTSEVRAEYRTKSKLIDDAITAITRAYSELETELQNRQIEMAAQRDYYNFFTDHDIDQDKLNFIILLKTYEFLKVFNNQVTEAWSFLRESFESIKVSSLTQQFLEQVLEFKIYPRLELCDLGDLLTRRLAYVLQVKTEQAKPDKVTARGEYTSLISYTFSLIFRDDLKSVLTDDKDEQPQKKARASVAETTYKDTCVKSPFLLDSRGNEMFNQGLVYVLEIQKERQRIEEQKVRRSVYVETHLGAEETALRQDLIRKFISAARNKDRIAEYNKFLNEYFDFIRDTILLQFFEFTEQEKNLLVYHLGPIYFLKIVLYFMREGRTGFIHRHLKKDQMVRELPLEYIKYVFKDWWDAKVYTVLTPLERNSRERYERIVLSIKGIWFREAPEALARIKADAVLLRAYTIHDVRALALFFENQLSLLIYVLLQRFLGPDFLYLELPSGPKGV